MNIRKSVFEYGAVERKCNLEIAKIKRKRKIPRDQKTSEWETTNCVTERAPIFAAAASHLIPFSILLIAANAITE
jgi:hypothetical protein